MLLRLNELAELVRGSVIGDDQVEIQGITTLREALPGQITLAEDPQHLERLSHSKAAAAIVAADSLTEEIPEGIALIKVADPRAAFAEIARAFCPPRKTSEVGVSPNATVSPSATLGENVSVGPGCVVGDDVTIGDGTVLHAGVVVMAGCEVAEEVTIFPRAVLYENTVIEPRCIIHASAVIGAYGFGYDSSEQGHVLSVQLGRVVLEADVEIGAGTTIDRGTYDATRIGEGTKLDNQVMIGHNCRIGRHNLWCAQSGIAGSSTTGDFVVVAGQVGIRDHIDVCDNVELGGKAGVAETITEPGQYLGSPAAPIRQQIQSMMAVQKLPEMRKQLRKLQATVDSLAKLASGEATVGSTINGESKSSAA